MSIIRAAAARFRVKKKHMETNLVLKVRDLEDRVKELQSENKRITNQMLHYRAESVKTKDLLLAHSDCSVTREMNKCELMVSSLSTASHWKNPIFLSGEVIAVVDSSTHLTVTRRQVKSSKSRVSQAPITVRRASVSKASSLTPLVIVRQTSGDGNGVLRFGGSSDSVIVENIQRPFTDWSQVCVISFKYNVPNLLSKASFQEARWTNFLNYCLFPKSEIMVQGDMRITTLLMCLDGYFL